MPNTAEISACLALSFTQNCAVIILKVAMSSLAQLMGNDADAPFLGVVVAEDLGLQVLGNGHVEFLLGLSVGWTRRGRKPDRTAPAQRQPQKWQCRAATRGPWGVFCGWRAAAVESATSKPSGSGAGEP